MKLTLRWCCMMSFLAVQTLSAQTDPVQRTFDEQLLAFARTLYAQEQGSELLDAEAGKAALTGWYDRVAGDALSVAEERVLYAGIINRVVRDQVSPEVKVMYLYLIEQYESKNSGTSLYRAPRRDVLLTAGGLMNTYFPDVVRGGELNLTEEHQAQLIAEALDGLREKGVDVAAMMALFQ